MRAESTKEKRFFMFVQFQLGAVLLCHSTPNECLNVVLSNGPAKR